MPADRRLNRRAFLLGGLGALAAGATGVGLVQTDVLPGRVSMDTLLGRCGEAPPVPAFDAPEPERHLLHSAARGREVAYVVARPPAGREPLPMCLVLHGRGADATAATDELFWHKHLAEAVATGTPPYALVSVDGGEAYWHPRASGEDPQRMVLDELLPALTERGLRTDRFAVAGWSMGGYGSLLLAQRLGPERVAAVATLSAALWEEFDDSAPGAFDSVEDFGAHDVLGAAGRLTDIPVRVRCGRSDPFVWANRELLRRLPTAVGSMTEGCHDAAYWRREATPMLRWVGDRLAG